MLKLPKGLKKKKKDKKKKNQELFTEEELEQYKREQKARQEAAEEEARKLAEEAGSTSGAAKQKTDEDEWKKFNQLTTGIDSILKKTQGDLDRIKESSFFQRVNIKKADQTVEQKPVEEENEKETVSEPELTEEEKETQRKLAALQQAVVELSESEGESEEADDIFDTDYIDTLTSGNVPLAFVPDSPEEEADLGPDPFDTTYADKLIKGPEVSKRGKKIVNIGSAVEVLTGKVEKVSTTGVKRPRRGPQNLLLESFDKGEAEQAEEEEEAVVVPPEPERPSLSLLDDSSDFLADAPIDLSASLHLQYLKQKEEEDEKKRIELERLRELEKDEFDELAAESLTKKEEIVVVTALEAVALAPTVETDTKWSEFEYEPKAIVELEEDIVDDSEDPFNTDYVASLVPEEDDDFDPRAEEHSFASAQAPQPLPIETQTLTVKQKDLLSGSTSDLTDLSHVPVIAASESIEVEIDPFDTSAVIAIVLPKETEIKFLEKELLSGTLKHSLSDPDFDPRAEEEATKPSAASIAERKSSLSLNVGNAAQKSVVFAVNDNLLGTSEGKPHKPLTPYYSDKPIEDEPADLLAVSETHDTKVLTPAAGNLNQKLEESFDIEDPFDTSNVKVLPGKTELKLLENELIERKQAAETSVLDINSDSQELGLGSKVLTPQITLPSEDSIDDIDPFDTSFASNIAPGQAEIKVLESELIHQ